MFNTIVVPVHRAHAETSEKVPDARAVPARHRGAKATDFSVAGAVQGKVLRG